MSYADHYSAKTMNRQGKSKDCRWKTALLRVHPRDASEGTNSRFPVRYFFAARDLGLQDPVSLVASA